MRSWVTLEHKALSSTPLSEYFIREGMWHMPSHEPSKLLNHFGRLVAFIEACCVKSVGGFEEAFFTGAGHIVTMELAGTCNDPVCNLVANLDAGSGNLLSTTGR